MLNQAKLTVNDGTESSHLSQRHLFHCWLHCLGQLIYGELTNSSLTMDSRQQHCLHHHAQRRLELWFRIIHKSKNKVVNKFFILIIKVPSNMFVIFDCLFVFLNCSLFESSFSQVNKFEVMTCLTQPYGGELNELLYPKQPLSMDLCCSFSIQ